MRGRAARRAAFSVRPSGGGAPVFEFLKRRDHNAQVLPAGVRCVVKAGDKLLNAALAAGLDWPHDCRVGSCGTCRCTLKDGRIKPLTDFAYTLSQADLAAGVILACQSQLRSDVVVEVTLGAAHAAAIERHRGHVARQRALTHDIVELSVSVPPGAFSAARAGQYADVQSDAVDGARSYSFARRPRDGEALRFYVRHVPGGAFTDWLFAADRSGSELELSGPYGAFHYRDGGGRMICVAGGSGLAPIHALLSDARERGCKREVTLLFGARAQRDLYCLDELATLAREWPARFTLLPVLSEEAADSAWQGARGLVTDQLALVAAPAFAAGDQGYLCGPPAMVDAGSARLAALGMDANAIFADRFLDASTQPGGRAALATPAG